MGVLRSAVVVGSAALLVAAGAASASTPGVATTSPVVRPTPDQSHAAHRRLAPSQLSSPRAARSLSRTWAADGLRQRQRQGGVIVLVIAFGSLGDDAVPIADLDHDGAQEVLQARAGAASPEIVVLSGRTGRPLWSVKGNGLIGAEYTSTPAGAGTVLVYSSRQDSPVDAVASAVGWTDSFVVDAVDARTGTEQWSQSLKDSSVDAGVGTWTGSEADGLLARRGQAPVLLLDTTTCAFALVSMACELHPLLVDVGSGKLLGAGLPIADDGFVWVQPLGDVNGDGTDDVADVAVGDAQAVSVWSGADGRPLWATVPQDSLTSLWPIGDVNGDGKADVVLGTFGPAGSVVAALDGSNGAQLWSRPGEFAAAVGDVDHDGRSDTRVVTFDPTLRYEVVSGTGRTLWSRSVPNPYSGQVLQLSYPAGDVNGDGVTDIYVRYVRKASFVSSLPGIASALLDGAHGTLRRLPDLGTPLGDSADGHGDDFYRAVTGKAGLTASLYDGATGRLQWHRTLGKDVTNLVDAWVGRLGAAHGRGLLVSVTGPRRESVVVQEAVGGAAAWSSSYGLAPGEPSLAV